MTATEPAWLHETRSTAGELSSDEYLAAYVRKALLPMKSVWLLEGDLVLRKPQVSEPMSPWSTGMGRSVLNEGGLRGRPSIFFGKCVECPREALE
jgi:hypothetical protein